MDPKWFKYTYVCHTCDALIEYTLELSNIPADVDVTQITCVCGGTAGQLSVEDATILPITKKKEDPMETMTDSFMQTKIIELEEIISRQNSALTTHENCDYWKSENGRVQGQLIELINDSYENDSDSEDILKSICEIIDYEPKKEVNFTATITVTGRMDVPLGEDVYDLLNAIEFSVDAYDGDVIIDDYSTNEIEEY